MRAQSTFQITRWQDAPGEPSPDDHVIGRATVEKTFRGDLEGTSVAELVLTKGADGSAAYVALERIEARLANRAGSFILLHAATATANGQHGDWQVVAGTGTGELRGLRGRGEYHHEASGAMFSLDYEFD